MRNFLKKSVAVVMTAAACLTVTSSYIEKPVSALTETKDLEYYTQSLTTLNEVSGQTMISGNQILIRFFVMGQREGCVTDINDMKWEVTGTADSKFKCGKFEVWGNGENPYGETYCLITADSPGTVNIKGTEINCFNKSELPSFYINLNVNEDGNFDNNINHDKLVESNLKGDTNGDGSFSVSDAVMLQGYLVGKKRMTQSQFKCADMNKDGKVNIFDLCIVKRELIAKSNIAEIKDGYIAVFHGIADDLTNETYIYKIDNGAANYGFEYINVSRSSFGIDHTERVTITGQGSVMWTDNVFQVAEANGAYDYVTVPNDETRYTIDEFMVRFLMD